MGPRRPVPWLSGLPRRPTLSDDGELTIGEGLYTSHRADAGRDPPVISARARTAQPRGAVGVPAAVRGRRSGGSPSGRCGRHDRRRPAPLSTQPNGYGGDVLVPTLVLGRRGCCCTRGASDAVGVVATAERLGAGRGAPSATGAGRGPPTWPRGSRIAEDGRAERSPLARGEQPVASRPHRKERTSQPAEEAVQVRTDKRGAVGRIARLRWHEGQLMVCRRFTGEALAHPALSGRAREGPRPPTRATGSGPECRPQPYLRRAEGAPEPPRAAHARGPPFPAAGHRSDGPKRAPERPAFSAPRPPDPGFRVPSCPMAPEAMRSARRLMPATGRGPGSARCASAPVVPRVSASGST